MSARATWKVSIAVMLSRFLGLLREMIFAGLFGGSRWMDCFYLAFRVPNLLRDLFAEGALSQAFVTVFAKTQKAEGERRAWELANKVMTLAAVVVGLISVLGVVMAPWIVEGLTAFSKTGQVVRTFNLDEFETTVLMVRVMYPFIVLVSLSALVMGVLNARNVFGAPALASCYFNVGSMVSGVLIGWWMDPNWGKMSLVGFSIGVVIGGLAQLVSQFPSLKAEGYRYVMDFRWKDSGVRQIMRLMVPAVISASVVQVNVVVNSMFAYGVGEGAVSWLSYAFRLMQLPIGVFGVAVATVTLPALSRSAVDEVGEEFRETLGKGLRLVMFLVIPSMLGLLFLSEWIVSLLYERGAFDVTDRMQTAGALRAYTYGLVFYAALKVVQPAFYAIEKRWLPLIVSVFALGLNLLCNWFFVFVCKWGHESLALTTSIIATVNFMILYTMMVKYVGDLGTKKNIVLLVKLLVAGGAMSGLCWSAQKYGFEPYGHYGFMIKAIGLMVTVGIAGVVYFGFAHVLKVDEAQEALNLVLRRFKKRG